MNILYAGTPSSSAIILRYLANNKHINIKGVLTQPDKRGKRGSNLIQSPVSIEAKSLKLDTYKPESIDLNEIKEIISALDIDFLIVIAYGKIIPSWLLELPNNSSINVHFSLLPKYRGASPIQASLLNGDNDSGISIIKMTKDLDAGDIISAFTIKINEDDNKLTLEDKLTKKCISKIYETLKNMQNNKIESQAQDHSRATYCKKIKKTDSVIDFSETSDDIINKFRAYYEWPGLCFKYKDINIKIHGIHRTNEISTNKPGTILKLNKEGLYVNTGDKVVVITYLQFPNKKIISSSDVFNSYKKFFQ